MQHVIYNGVIDKIMSASKLRIVIFSASATNTTEAPTTPAGSATTTAGSATTTAETNTTRTGSQSNYGHVSASLLIISFLMMVLAIII